MQYIHLSLSKCGFVKGNSLIKGGKMLKSILKYFVLIMVCGLIIYMPISFLVNDVNGKFETSINEENKKDFVALNNILKKIDNGEEPSEELKKIDNHSFSKDGSEEGQYILSLQNGFAIMKIHLNDNYNIVKVDKLTSAGATIFRFYCFTFIIGAIIFLGLIILLVKIVNKILLRIFH